MRNLLEERTFDMKFARVILNFFAFAFFGLILYVQFINVIEIQTAAAFIFADCMISAFANYGLRKYEKEQRAEQERLLREREEKQRMRKEIETLKAELEKNKKQS